MNQDRRLIWGIVLAILAVLFLCCIGIGIAWWLVTDRDSPVSEDTLTLTLIYSPEKESWLIPLVQQFNEGEEQIGERTIYVSIEAMDSGEALEAIVAGDRYPTVWSPASTLWVPLLNQRWQESAATPEPLAIYPEPLVVSPLVIAMWEDEARALGYPDQNIGWQEIISATLDPQGEFKLGHTNPYFSNSGLLSIAAEGYAAVGKVRDLTPEDLAQQETRAYVQEIERAIIHYGESSEYFAEQMALRGPAYASAVILEEHTVVRLNSNHYGQLQQPLVAIYPKEGTFWSDHPYVILRGDWVGTEQQAAALILRDFLLSEEAQKKALESGFRPADTNIPLANSVIRKDLGVDPFQPQTILEVPSAETLNALLQTWQEARKRVNVILVVDISGSMEGAKLAGVQDGLKLFLEQLAADDNVGILAFNDRIETLTPLDALGTKQTTLEAEIDFLQAEYKTVLHDVTIEALHQMTAVYDPERINAIVLMTDGLDTASRNSRRELFRELEASAPERAIRIFTIAYGSDADRGLLQQIADITEGRMVEGTPENIRRIYVILSSYF